jgi:hypothetical protein
MADSVIGLCKTECVRDEGPWRGVDDLDLTQNPGRFLSLRLPSLLHHQPDGVTNEVNALAGADRVQQLGNDRLGQGHR